MNGKIEKTRAAMRRIAPESAVDEPMSKGQLIRMTMTHVALVCQDGHIDASLAPSYEGALAVLRQRAEAWDWEIDPEHPLDRSTATLEQLSELYAYDGNEATCWVNIAEVWASCQPCKNYILKYKVRGERMHRLPLPNMAEEQALQQFEATRTSLLLCGNAVYVRLFAEKNTVPHRETLF